LIAKDDAAAGGQTLVSANCHLVETPDVFTGRVPGRFAEAAPRVVDAPDGTQQWIFEDQVRPILRNCAIAGIPKEKWIGPKATRYEFMRAGCYDAHARLLDMDLDGISATVLYPSPAGMGFGGDLLSHAKDPELGLACVRAWNDWYLEKWVSVAPDRYIPVQIPHYGDPVAAAEEVRRNAERGFRAVTFRNPTDKGLPSVRSGYWDPFFRACEETSTVLCNHTESQPHWPPADPEAPYGERNILFQSAAMEVVVTWLWGGIPVRFPNLRIAIAESGGGWLPHMIDRLQWCVHYSPQHARRWPAPDREPVDVLREAFVFSSLEVETAVKVEAEHGISGWMMESDYPHMESVWPHSRQHYSQALEGLDPAWAQGFTWENVTRLFRHELPAHLRVLESPLNEEVTVQ